MRRLDSKASLILSLTVLFAAVLSCTGSQTVKETTLFEQYYSMNPATLMPSLKSGDAKAFIPKSQELGLLPVDQQVPVDWFQSDYFYVANSLYEKVLNDPLQGWQLSSMDFSTNCSYVSTGFQNGRFDFFKVEKKNERQARVIRFTDIDPRGNFVHVKESEFYPTSLHWEAIDLAQLKISADQALQIAEAKGGQEKRQSLKDACAISLILAPNSASYRGWAVFYTRSADSTSLFKIYIDPITGEARSR